jgi:hypothetical protein
MQVLHAASGCTFSKATTSSFVIPWRYETATAAAVATPPQVQQLLKEFPTLLWPSGAHSNLSTESSIHFNTGSTG